MTVDGTANHPGGDPNRPQAGTEHVLAGHRPVDAVLQRLGALIADSPHNLVARGDRATMLRRHIAECDAVARVLAPHGRWMDLGTGGGLPGLVLAYRHPGVSWTLVDATAKKVEEVGRFAETLGLTNVIVIQGRAEALAHDPAHRGAYQGVVARALAQLSVLAELARGFLTPDGRLVAMKGPAWEAELQRATVALRVLHLHRVHTERLHVPDRASWLVTMRADGPPPRGYPRRDGIPKQQPLA